MLGTLSEPWQHALDLTASITDEACLLKGVLHARDVALVDRLLDTLPPLLLARRLHRRGQAGSTLAFRHERLPFQLGQQAELPLLRTRSTRSIGRVSRGDRINQILDGLLSNIRRGRAG